MLLAVRNIASGTILNEVMVGQLTMIKLFAVPTIIFIIGGGLWTFYQALKEEK